MDCPFCVLNTAGQHESDCPWHPQNMRVEVRVDEQIMGWICPKCGKSLAPWVRACDCARSNLLSTYPGTPTDVSESNTWEPFVTTVWEHMKNA